MFNIKNPIVNGALAGVAVFIILFALAVFIPGMRSMGLPGMLGISLGTAFMSYRGAKKKLAQSE